ncbi:MAG: BREX-2 system phosphatase PglZ [Sandaracinaceae bacterium]|nr:MAG: BREX-2 system phosphatase PglZ [Sandaracinaceae bacterium]
MHAEVLLKKILDAAGARDRGYVLTLGREGLGEVPDELRTAHGTWHVVHPTSELDLRHTLWKAGGGAVVAVLPETLADGLAVDLVRRSLSGRIIALEPVDILSTVLGVPVHGLEDDSIQELALQHVEQLRAAIGQRTLPTVIDRRLLDELLLDVCVGARIRQVDSAGVLLAEWLRKPPTWSPEVTKLVERNLPRLLGPEGRLLAWALEAGGERVLEELVVRGLLLAIPADELPASVWGSELDKAKGSRTVDLSDEGALRTTIAGIAVDAMDALEAHAHRYLEAAQSIGRKILTPSVLGRSVHLPLGLENRCHALVTRIREGENIGSEDIEWLRRHRSAALMRSEIALLEEMARLARWLHPDESPPASTVLDAVRQYQRDGAFADLAASHLSRALGQTGSWHAEARHLLERWEARRNEMNERFASMLAKKYVDTWHAEGVVPLHRVWTEAVFKGESCRRNAGAGGVLLVVLDGCSYPIFVDLLHQLSERHPSIGMAPVGNGDGELRAEGIAALAPLPSITSHARGAIFLGELPQDPWAAELAWRETGERKTDPARFQQNKALGDRSRRLFLKRDLDDGGQALRSAVGDPELDVVAVVFNAVDDLISGHATGVTSRLAPSEIHGFLPALDASFAAGRSVILTADHGHTPFLGKERNVGKGPAARWAQLADGEKAPEGWLEVDVEGLGGPAGRKAFAWKMGSYRGKPHVGFHGGCGLEEMVVPLAWLRPGGVGADLPAWWYGSEVAGDNLDYSGIESQAAKKPRRTRKKSGAVAGQLDLYDARRTTAAIGAKLDPTKLGLPAKALEALDDTAKATLCVLEANGSATSTELSKVQQRSAARVNGYMTKLNRQLFALGVTCFDSEKLPTGEVQYKWTGGGGE